MRSLLLLLLFCVASQADRLDSLAITVGPAAITELQIDEDLRVAALLNGTAVRRDDESRRVAADRLVEQLLIRHEIEISRYPEPTDKEVNALYSSVEQTVGGEQQLKKALSEYQVDQQTLRAHLISQLSTLKFIEFRFRPDVNVTDSDIEQAYQRLVAKRKADSLDPILLDANQKAQITENLIADSTDAALNSWLAETRKQNIIRYVDVTLK